MAPRQKPPVKLVATANRLDRMLRRVVQQTADIVMITDVHGRIEYVNPAFERITGFSQEEAIGQTPRILRSGLQGTDFYARLWQTIARGEVFHDTVVNRRRDGSLYYEDKTISPLFDEAHRIVGYVSTGRDITERIRSEQRLNFLANHDPLTRLPNRQSFAKSLQQAQVRCRRLGHALAVICFDIDHFRLVNTALDTRRADEILTLLVERLRNRLRADDLMARLDGDRFVVLLEGHNAEQDAQYVADKMQAILRQPFPVAGEEIILTASFGIGCRRANDDGAGDLVHQAEEAMQRIKHRGGNGIGVFDHTQEERSRHRLSLQSRLHRALERDEFVLHYQPQVCATSHRLLGVEALLRWQPPGEDLVSPLEFIPILEETGLIVPVGEWVLDRACGDLRQWRDAGLPDFSLAVNVSPRQLHRGDLLAALDSVLERHALGNGDLHLEVTESLMIDEDPTLDGVMQALDARGAILAIDDFGTGYASLTYLTRFPFRCLKLDRRFITDVCRQADPAAIVTAMIRMAHALGMTVIAEGVETATQAQFLQELGCDRLQGFLFSRPLPAEDLIRRLQAGTVLAPDTSTPPEMTNPA